MTLKLPKLKLKINPKRISIFVLLLMMISAGFFVFLKAREASADWWNGDWFFRKNIIVTNNTTEENNVYITLTLDTSDQEKFQADCGDIRFITTNGTILDYYIVSGCGATSTIIHTNFEVFPAGAQTISFYYGNPTVDNGFNTSDFATPASNYTIGTIYPEEKGPAPVLYFSLDEGLGTTAHDESSNHNDGTIVGATWKDESMCKSGKCLEFDGTGDYVEVADNHSLDLSNEFTLEAWVKPQSTNLANQTIISKEETPSEPTKIYRSVGPSATTAIAVGTTNAMTIVGDRATFQTALPDNVGVGDAIQYDDDNDNDIDASDSIVFINERLSGFEYRVATASGTVPVAVQGDNNWSLFRAYSSLSNAEAGIENTGIDSDLRNFDDWTAGGDATTDDVGKDLVTANQQWNIACYANGVTADTTAVTIFGWNTGAQNFIKVYTPVDSNEIGILQRHSGKWNDGRYRLAPRGTILTLLEKYITIDGLQLAINDGWADTWSTAINIPWSATEIESIFIKNNIIKNVNPILQDIGILIGPNLSGFDCFISNNIIYNFQNGTGVSSNAGSGNVYSYNNTVYNSTVSYSRNNNTVFLVNNIAQGCLGTCFSGSFAGNSSNNISSDATAPGSNSKSSTTASFVSTTAGSEDLHLSPTDTAAKDSGADLSSDNVFPFAMDIDGQSRLRSSGYDVARWDIGADEAMATQIYRSVAPNKTDALETGEENSLSIVGNTATFQSALANNVGVGDVIQYDDDNDGDIDANDSLAFIAGRISNFEYIVTTASGSVPTTVIGDNDWSLFRAYSSLFDAEAGNENTGIDSDLRNFDTWTGGKDLVASKEQWNIACYANGTTADGQVNYSGWTTGVLSFIKVYTPISTSEVGISQRHSGVWDDNKYHVVVSSETHLDYVIGNESYYFHMDGIQIKANPTTMWATMFGFRSILYSGSTAGNLQINNSIFTQDKSTSNTAMVAVESGRGAVTYNIYNNIFHDMRGNGDGGGNRGIGISISDSSPANGNAFIYNNTFANITPYGTGVNIVHADKDILKNNLFSNVTTAATGTFLAGTDYNATNNASMNYTVTGGGNTHDKINQTFSFVNEAGGDYHLTPTDTVARNAGIDLSNDPFLPFNTDIDRNERIASSTTWDIGADESATTKIYRSVGPGNTTALATDDNHENTVSVTDGIAIFENDLPARIGVGDAVLIDTNSDNAITSADTLLFIHGRNSSVSYDVRTHTGAMPTDISSNDTYKIFRAYTSLANAEAGIENTGIAVTTFNGGDRDLVTNNEEWNIACYGDGVDTAAVVILGWTTGVENFVSIYTPVSPSEVGISQRHSGKWNTGKYYLQVSNLTAISVRSQNVRLDGLQVFNTNSSNWSDKGIWVNTATLNDDIRIFNNIIKSDRATTTNVGGVSIYNSGSGKAYIYNNIVYDFTTAPSGAFYLEDAGYTAYFYNNVAVNTGNGFNRVAGTAYLKNNISYNNTNDYLGTYDPSSASNISKDAKSPNSGATDCGGHSCRNQTVNFVDEANDDFRLAMTDTSAKGAGLNLTYDPNQSVTSDIEGEQRPGLEYGGGNAPRRVPTLFDIGADQISGTIHNNYSFSIKTDYPIAKFSTLQSDNKSFSSGDSNLEESTWSHIVYKRSNNGEELYINGFKKDSTTISDFVISNNGKLYLGAKNSSSKDSFKGLMDEIRIYNYARTETDIKKDTSSGSAGIAASRASEGVSVAVGAKAQTLADGLVGYWKMDETATTTGAIDSSGNGNNGTYIGNASTTGGKFGNGGGFDDAGYINIKANGAPNGTGAPFTIAAWVRTSNTSQTSYPVALTDYYNWPAIQTLAGSWYFNVWGNVLSLAAGPIVAGEWVYVVGTYDGSTARVYKNGQLISSLMNVSPVSPGSTIQIGGSDTFTGSVDETRVYNRALSPDEVKQLYNYAPGPVLHLKMDEKEGTTAFDSSGNGNDALFSGSSIPTWSDGKYGSALKFDGNNNDFMNAGSKDVLDYMPRKTITAWIKPEMKTGSCGVIVDKMSVGYTGWSFELCDYAGTDGLKYWQEYDSDSGYWSSPDGSLSYGNWQHVALVFDNTSDTNVPSLYINGVIQTVTAIEAGTGIPSNDSVYNMHIGNSEDNIQTFNGQIDDLKIYNYARTQEQILEDMGGQGTSLSANGTALKKPILDLNFDEGRGSIAYDGSGNGFNGTLVSGATGGNTTSTAMWDKGGKFGGAMEFDGTNDYVEIYNGRISNASEGAISAWISFSERGNLVTYGGGNVAAPGIFEFDIRQDTNYYLAITQRSDGGNWSSMRGNIPLSINTWYHVVLSSDGSTWSMYVNGEKDSLSALGGNVDGNNGDWFGDTTVAETDKTSIGNIMYDGAYTGTYYKGFMDELKIYNYALSDDDIKTLYNGTKAMTMGNDANRNNNGTTVTGANKDYCIPGDTAKCDKPVLELKMDEMSGTTTYDTSGNGNNGAISGAIWEPVGKVGSALSFDGVDDAVQINDINNSLDGLGAQTLSLWYYPTASDTNWKILAGKGINVGNYGLWYKDDTFVAVFESGGWKNHFSNPGFLPGAWYHIVGVFDNTNDTVRIFINGKDEASTSPTEIANMVIDDNPFYISSSYGGNRPQGIIDDVKVYNYARTPAQIAWDYNRGKPIAHWRFNEGSGALAHDESGNSYNGTLSNMNVATSWAEGKFGKAVDFDGSNGFVNTSLSMPSQAYTKTAWIKREAGDDQNNIISGSTGHAFWVPYSYSNICAFCLAAGNDSPFNDVQDTEAIEVGKWYYVAVSYDPNKNSGEMKLYKEGIMVDSATGVPNNIDSVTYIGRWGAGFTFNGLMDEVKIFNYALTEEQIKMDYNGGAVSFR